MYSTRNSFGSILHIVLWSKIAFYFTSMPLTPLIMWGRVLIKQLKGERWYFKDVLKELHVTLKEFPGQNCKADLWKKKYLSGINLKINIEEWNNKNPNVNNLMIDKKTLKGLKGQLRKKLLQSSNIEEPNEYNETSIVCSYSAKNKWNWNGRGDGYN